MSTRALMAGCLFVVLVAAPLGAEDLTSSTDLSISKAWSQEPQGWTYEVGIHVPDQMPVGGHPVCILLHGADSSGAGLLAAMPEYLPDHVLLAPAGYLQGWNICREDSRAPDLEMVEELIESVRGYDNINANAIRILGFSNGAALTHRIYIENDDPGIDAVVTVVSQLSVIQHHGGSFRAPFAAGSDPELPFCAFGRAVDANASRRYLNICNVNDPFIFYEGGFAPVSGIHYHEARYSTFLVASEKGYTGPPILDDGEQIPGTDIFKYGYLNDSVVHLRGSAKHGWTPEMRTYAGDFLSTWPASSDCPADLDGDGTVGGSDLAVLLAAWGTSDPAVDLDGDGTVDGQDLSLLLGVWSGC